MDSVSKVDVDGHRDPKFVSSPTDYLFEQCHAASIVRVPEDGTMLAVWFAGTREKHPDTAIWMSILKPSSHTWSAPVQKWKVRDDAHWNPVLFSNGKHVMCFFKVGRDIETWETYVSKMHPDGSWSEPETLVRWPSSGKGGRGPVRSKPIVLASGRWLAPASCERIVSYQTKQHPTMKWMILRVPLQIWDSFVDISDDEGKSWKRSKMVPYSRKKWGEYGGLIQPTMWESSSIVHMLIRSNQGQLFRSDSDDQGQTWSEADETGIPNPNSAVDIQTMEDGTLILAHNPVSGDWAPRTPLSISYSTDDGCSWSDPTDVESGKGSFSYPFMIPEKDGFSMSYTWMRTGIACVRYAVSKCGDVRSLEKIPVNPM